MHNVCLVEDDRWLDQRSMPLPYLYGALFVMGNDNAISKKKKIKHVA